MARVVWSQPALSDLDAVADFIALDNPGAASRLIQRIFQHVDHLAEHPNMGAKPPELSELPYRQVVEPPCRVLYRVDGDTVYIVHVMRSEQRLTKSRLPP